MTIKGKGFMDDDLRVQTKKLMDNHFFEIFILNYFQEHNDDNIIDLDYNLHLTYDEKNEFIRDQIYKTNQRIKELGHNDLSLNFLNASNKDLDHWINIFIEEFIFLTTIIDHPSSTDVNEKVQYRSNKIPYMVELGTESGDKLIMKMMDDIKNFDYYPQGDVSTWDSDINTKEYSKFIPICPTIRLLFNYCELFVQLQKRSYLEENYFNKDLKSQELIPQQAQEVESLKTENKNPEIETNPIIKTDNSIEKPDYDYFDKWVNNEITLRDWLEYGKFDIWETLIEYDLSKEQKENIRELQYSLFKECVNNVVTNKLASLNQFDPKQRIINAKEYNRVIELFVGGSTEPLTLALLGPIIRIKESEVIPVLECYQTLILNYAFDDYNICQNGNFKNSPQLIASIIYYFNNELLKIIFPPQPIGYIKPNLTGPKLTSESDLPQKLISFDDPKTIDKLFTELRGFFPGKDDDLIKALNGEKLNELILFPHNGNRFVEVFRRLNYNGKILNKYTEIRDWICLNFAFYSKNESKKFTPDTVYDILKGNSEPTKQQRILNNVDWLPYKTKEALKLEKQKEEMLK